MSRFKILICEPLDFTSEVIDSLRNVADVTISKISQKELKAAFKEYHAIWIRLGYNIDKTYLEGAINCKYLIVPVTGLDHIDIEECLKKGIEIISLKGETEFLKEIRATAELTIALTLALMRKLIPACISVSEGKWSRDNFRGSEIYGKNVGIIGVGRLGKIVGGYFNALGANVYGYDIIENFPENIHKVNNLSELLSNSDIVSIHLELNDSTKNFINNETLALFKKGSILINTSRGNVIDEDSLLDALENETLSGAALDVINNEMNFNMSNRFVKYLKTKDNLIISPHLGGNTYESFAKTEKFIADKLISKIEINQFN
jgi:D-3-phosphoglycerate dehydrogenase / 2-oxoglutarate reductase